VRPNPISVRAHHTANRLLLTSFLRYMICREEAERLSSPAAGSGRDAGANAGGSPVQRFVVPLVDEFQFILRLIQAIDQSLFSPICP
jgi:hypothetical protein